MWACYGGHLRIVWLLLINGYNPDDLDPMGNNCLHLAASSGHAAVLQTLVDDGANPFVSNVYKNRPIDVASSVACREILSHAMERYSTLDIESIKSLHLTNVETVCLFFTRSFLILLSILKK
jgi:ankyrin repeat protein